MKVWCVQGAGEGGGVRVWTRVPAWARAWHGVVVGSPLSRSSAAAAVFAPPVLLHRTQQPSTEASSGHLQQRTRTSTACKAMSSMQPTLRAVGLYTAAV